MHFSNSCTESCSSAFTSAAVTSCWSAWSGTQNFHRSMFLNKSSSAPAMEPLLSLSTAAKKPAKGFGSFAMGLMLRASTKSRLKPARSKRSAVASFWYSSAGSKKRLRSSTASARSSRPCSTPFLSASVCVKSCTMTGPSAEPQATASMWLSSVALSSPSESPSASSTRCGIVDGAMGALASFSAHRRPLYFNSSWSSRSSLLRSASLKRKSKAARRRTSGRSQVFALWPTWS
mmetsp:Transcript_16280/g.38218  ORF Transcript_16280/g.38218 Transcript_16280/m.38218 type:complete len:233 (+) Transcript_16280:436-1134(+)